MKKELAAALKGPELKEVKINGHEFNIKPVSYRIHEDEIIVFGQLSHSLRFRTDDQIWYAFKKKGNVVTPSDPVKMIVQTSIGGAIATILRFKKIAIPIAAIFGVDATNFFDDLENNSEKLSFIDFDGGWESAAKSFLIELATAIIPPAPITNIGLQLYQDDNLRGKSITIKDGQDVAQASKIGWNDKASSLKALIPEGKKLELYQHSDYKGLELELGPGSHLIRDLKIHKIGDEISSFHWENI